MSDFTNENTTVYDNGGETIDRYTIVTKEYLIFCSDNPSDPTSGVWKALHHLDVGAVRIKEFRSGKATEQGEKINWADLPEKVKTYHEVCDDVDPADYLTFPVDKRIIRE